MAYRLIKNAFVVTMDETQGDFRGDIRRNRERQSHVTAGAAVDLRVDADHLARIAKRFFDTRGATTSTEAHRL